MDTYLRNRFCPCIRCKMNDMMGPAVLVSLGTMWLLHNVTHSIRLSSVFAVVLIVIGAVKLLQGSAATEGHIQPGTMPAGGVPPVPPPQSASASNEVQNG